jgi:hypothetical protein
LFGAFHQGPDFIPSEVVKEINDRYASNMFSLTSKDLVKWTWEKTENFSVKSMYDHLCSGDVNEPNKKIWKSKIPLKIKIFMWLIQQNAILTIT